MNLCITFTEDFNDVINNFKVFRRHRCDELLTFFRINYRYIKILVIMTSQMNQRHKSV